LCHRHNSAISVITMKILIGKVISKKMDKTATVAVERIMIHPLYLKRYKSSKKYHVQDELGTEVGQRVKFIATKPYSRLKRWKIVEIIMDSKFVTGKVQKSPQRRKKGESQRAH